MNHLPQENVIVCLFLCPTPQVHIIFQQVNLTIEEHTRELLALNRKFGVTLLDAVTLLQDSDLFLESVKVEHLKRLSNCLKIRNQTESRMRTSTVIIIVLEQC